MENEYFELDQLFDQYPDAAKGLAAVYQIFLGGVPTVAGFTYLINNAVETNYGAGGGVEFNTENIFINLANALVGGNGEASSKFNTLIGSSGSLAEQVSALYDALIPEDLQTEEGRAFLARPEALAFYQQLAAERGISGEAGAAVVALSSLLNIMVRESIGVGDAVNDLIAAVNDGTANLPADGDSFSEIETADGEAYDDDDAIGTDTGGGTSDGGTGDGGTGGGGSDGSPQNPSFTNAYDDLSPAAVFDDGDSTNADEMYVGGGNPTDGFAVSRNTAAGIELALDARYRGDSSDVAPVDPSPDSGPIVFEMAAERGENIRFAYSVASTDGGAIDLDTYDFKLFIDKDPGEGEDWVELKLQPDGGTNPYSNNADSSYDWGIDGSAVILDDGGSNSVSQNIQAFQWYSGNIPGVGEHYGVRLAAFEKGTDTLVADTQIVIDVDHGAFTNAYDDLSPAAVFDDGDSTNADEMYVGGGNPTDGFAVSRNTAAGIELALDARYRGDSSDVAPVDPSPDSGPIVFEMAAERGENIRFAYSVASTDGGAIDLDTYDFKLFIDKDPGEGEDWVELKLQPDGGTNPYSNNADSSYDWGIDGSAVILDDGGSNSVSQNIQAFQWYSGNIPGVGEHYGVRLAAFEKGTDTLVADTQIVIDVDHGAFTNAYDDLSPAAVFDDGDSTNADEMYVGGGNPTDGFAVSRNTAAGIELALDARYRGDSSDVAPVDPSPDSGPIVFEMAAERGENIRFAYSVASTDGGAIDLDTYDFKLFIDKDPGEGEDWVELKLQPDGGTNPYSNNADSSYDWGIDGSAVILDDGGSNSVSQNIQAFQWYSGNIPGVGEHYGVRLAAFEKGTDTLVADTQIVIDVVGAAPPVEAYLI